MANSLRFNLLPGRFCIHKLEADAEIPKSLLEERHVWIGRTEDELSIVCRSLEIDSKVREENWVCLQVADEMAFDIVGVIATISRVIAENGIPIFCISTFNTDYVLVNHEHESKVLEVLRGDGHQVDV